MHWGCIALALSGCRLFGDYVLEDDTGFDEVFVPPEAPADGLRVWVGPVDLGSRAKSEVCVGVKNGSGARFVESIDVAGTSNVHHAYLFKIGVDVADGPVDCLDTIEAAMAVEVPTLEFVMGAFTPAHTLAFPPGLGVELAAEQQLVAVVHFAQPDGQPGPAEAVVDLHFAPAEVEALHAYSVATLGFLVPAETDRYRVTTTCTLPHDMAVFSMAPHMHERGVALSAEHESADGTITALLDGELETVATFDPVLAMQAGDLLRTTCEWSNPGATTYAFGDELGDEMCTVLGYAAGLGGSLVLSDFLGHCVLE